VSFALYPIDSMRFCAGECDANSSTDFILSEGDGWAALTPLGSGYIARSGDTISADS